MRTPGADFELAAGFLFGEGVLKSREQLRRISYCVDPDLDDEQRYNTVNVEVSGVAHTDLVPLERHFSMTSACGVCGKATLESLRTRGYCLPAPGDAAALVPEVLSGLPAKLRHAQQIFEATGGLHAAGLFSLGGELVVSREDIGRHNALDKVVGWAFLQDGLPLRDYVLVVSGRASFELVQKSLAAGVTALCSVSAPSSLAVHLANEFGLALLGFLREGRFRIYAGAERVSLPRGRAVPGLAARPGEGQPGARLDAGGGAQ
jgi:FdhD protein